MLARLDDVDILAPADIERARSEFGTLRSMLRPGGVRGGVPRRGDEPIQGDSPSHNVIRTTTPLLADGLAEAVDDWRAAAPFN